LQDANEKEMSGIAKMEDKQTILVKAGANIEG